MMDNDLERAGLTIDVGGRLRELRQGRDMSMRALAARQRFIHQRLEHDRAG